MFFSQPRFNPLIGLLLFLFGCNCIGEKEDTFYVTPLTSDNFTGFGTGSYWVYQRLGAPSVFDTLVLSDRLDSLVYWIGPENCPGDYHQTITYWLVSTEGDSLFHRAYTHRNMDFFDGYGAFDGLGYAPSFMVNKKTLTFSPLSEDSVALIPSMEIQGAAYSNIVRLERPLHYWLDQKSNMVYYYARNVGLVRFELVDEDTGERRIYELKSYHLQ